MNWTVVAILVTIGLAQSGLVVGLLDRLFKAETRVLAEAIRSLQAEIQKRDNADAVRDAKLENLDRRVQRIEDRLEGCLNGELPRCSP